MIYDKISVKSQITHKYYVYGLINPVNNIVFYIGKGIKDRLFLHESKVKNQNKWQANKHLTNKIKKIKRAGLDILYTIFYNTNNEDSAYKKECDLLLQYKATIVNIHYGIRGRQSGSIIETYGLDRATQIKKKISDNHYDVSGDKNPKYKQLPKTIEIVEIEGLLFYEFNCANPNNNIKCRIKIRYPMSIQGKSRAVCRVGKAKCVSCGVAGINNAMYGKPGSMTGKTTFGIWVEKYGVEKAQLLRTKMYAKMSKTITGRKHTEETKRKMSISNSKPKSEAGRMNIRIAAQNRMKL